ncbi:SMP-30/gluconolactonase/LRE family protein [Pseudobythopirellula maris]|uniref:SMP-30/gluconolactonase/LRE family protein n=1 Tax=Pseudobythopirellula maris TaxID=2527991 RepID=UPI001E5CD089|nr:SMP-30/gluconolactonase/LRE family protein [Pseudobythopirellula maris]
MNWCHAQDTTTFPTLGEVVRLDPALDELIEPGAKIEVLAGGFDWSEGPVWVPRDGGFLLFSDIPPNRVMKWVEGQGVSVFLDPSGYTGVGRYSREPGSNGMFLDPKGDLTLCEHGDRRVAMMTWDGGKRTLVDNYQGKRLNSPNDCVWSARGDLYFTDPPYGLPGQWDSPQRELDFCGVYRLSPAGELSLVDRTLNRPNGIGLSPDGRTLYVAQSESRAAIWRKYPVADDGSVGDGELFFDATEQGRQMRGLPDGLAVDAAGNVWATGPGGVWVFSPEGEPLGRIATGEATANCCFGGADGSHLYMTADMWLCRIKTKSKGQGF